MQWVTPPSNLTKRAIWQYPDGTIVQMIPFEPMLPGETEDAYIDRLAAVTQLNCPPGSVRLPNILISELPDRRFRNAWRAEPNGKIHVKMSLAIDIILAEVQKERQKRLDKSDKDKSRLDDIGTPQQKKALADYRQLLRDLPAKVSADVSGLTTPGQLEAYAVPWPIDPAAD